MTLPTLITVTALPRSGTAWLSAFFNLHPSTVAYHELAAYDKDWRRTLLIHGYEYVVDCSTYGYVKEAQLDSDIRILIKNDPDKSHRSSEALLNTTLNRDTFHDLAAMSYRWARNTDALIIENSKLFTVQTCRDIWTYCYTEPFPELKVRQLLKLNIQHQGITSGRFSKFVI